MGNKWKLSTSSKPKPSNINKINQGFNPNQVLKTRPYLFNFTSFFSFLLWFDIIAFGYFVISVVISHYCFRLFCYFHCDLTLSASDYYVHYDRIEHVVIAFGYLLLIVRNFTASSILSYVLCDGFSETPKIEVLYTFVRTPFFD